jgi:hypothetical protein
MTLNLFTITYDKGYSVFLYIFKVQYKVYIDLKSKINHACIKVFLILSIFFINLFFINLFVLFILFKLARFIKLSQVNNFNF